MTERSTWVGPVLEASEAGQALCRAIRANNPGVEVLDRGAYLRIEAAGQLTLTRVAAEEALGRPFHLPQDLEQLMPAFKGRLTIDSDCAKWMHADAEASR